MSTARIKIKPDPNNTQYKKYNRRSEFTYKKHRQMIMNISNHLMADFMAKFEFSAFNDEIRIADIYSSNKTNKSCTRKGLSVFIVVPHRAIVTSTIKLKNNRVGISR